ncbi:hypothetical protein LSH36_61g10008 [Paralvinella palmiformis]|uniref:Uncharacterized protein n=1 Tax=Paralvinella palmiformis TaxID=53620 RepID=A0AAD9NEV7_9ANNE|nr:hypothetical protein LSH36_61g10008 [Paralvinella palmiformis]
MEGKASSSPLRYGHYPRQQESEERKGQTISNALFVARIVISWFILLVLTVVMYFLMQGKMKDLYTASDKHNITIVRILMGDNKTSYEANAAVDQENDMSTSG